MCYTKYMKTTHLVAEFTILPAVQVFLTNLNRGHFNIHKLHAAI